jgi:sugar phosphate isomerase/epimerase
MKRRDFISLMAGSVAATSLLHDGRKLWAAAQGHAARPPAGDKRQRIAVSTWSLHNYFPSTREKGFSLPGNMLALLDFPEMIADKYKVHHLEFCAPHFATTEPAYLKELKNCLVRARADVVNMPIDIEEIRTEGGLSDPSRKVRENAISAAKKWIEVAAVIGSKAVRCDPGKMDGKNLAPTISSYRRLSDYGRSKGVRVIIENHGGVGSEHPEELVKVFKRVGGSFIGALPDFANFPNEPIREKGLELLFPYARGVCHAKGIEFDANGDEKRFNFPKCVEISKKAGFKGVYSIEFEGPGDPYVGVQKTLDELLKYL